MIINGIVVQTFSNRSHCGVRYEASDFISTISLHQRQQIQFHIHFSNLILCLIVWLLRLSAIVLFTSPLFPGIFFFRAGLGRRTLAELDFSRAAYPCQKMSSPNHCFPQRRCDKISARGLASPLIYRRKKRKRRINGGEGMYWLRQETEEEENNLCIVHGKPIMHFFQFT